MKIIDKIKHTKDLKAPEFIVNRIVEIVKILNKEYGKDRNSYTDDGGYIILMEYKADYDIPDFFEFIVNQEPEIVKEIETEQGVWLEVLYLMNNEFGVTLFTKKEWANPNITKAI